MNRIYIYVMLFSEILFINSMTCFAANENYRPHRAKRSIN